ncbi:MAG: MFS transporter [Candidatus Hydrothermales bacterium]
MKNKGIVGVIKNRNFFLYSLAQTISLIGDKLDHISLIALLKAKAFGHSVAFSHLAFFFTIPGVIFGPIAGIIADRVNRKMILVLGDFLRGLLVFMIPLAVLSFGHIFPMYIIVFFVFLIGVLYNATKMAIIPSLLKSKDEILAANSVATLTGRLATVIGLFAGGLIVDWEIWKNFGIEGWQAGFYIDALTFLISGLLLAFLVIPDERKLKGEDLKRLIIEEEKNYFQRAIADLKEALVLILKDKNVSFVLFSLFFLVFIGANVYVLIVILVQQFLGYGTTGIGKLGALTALGMVSGAFLLGSFGDKLDRKAVIKYSFLILSFLLIFFSFLKRFLYIGIFSFLGGFILSSVTIFQDTILHENVPKGLRGRIFASKELLVNSLFLILSYIFGILAEYIYPAKIIFVNGLILLLMTIFFLLVTK